MLTENQRTSLIRAMDEAIAEWIEANSPYSQPSRSHGLFALEAGEVVVESLDNVCAFHRALVELETALADDAISRLAAAYREWIDEFDPDPDVAEFSAYATEVDWLTENAERMARVDEA